MHTVTVATPGGQYPIHIASGRLDALAQSIPTDATTIALVTNPVIQGLMGERVTKVLAATGKRIVPIVLPDGEAYKSWETLNLIFDAMLGAQLDRRTVIVALGGGVIGDMAGFAAAVYMRGVRFVQVPTTLLSQVDSSVGGKTAVNHPLGKNMIGAFYQPIAVEIDTDVLNTLPDREMSAGLAEVIKYGLILDAEFFAWCEKNVAGLRARDPVLLAEAIRRSCEYKAWVVSKDERETGLRAILNLGHTFGHAIEAGMGYGQWLHGEAVGCGMVLASDLSVRLGLMPPEFLTIKAADGVTDLYGLLYKPRDFDPSRRYPLMVEAYGGPLVATVSPRYGSVEGAAEFGMLVAKVDNRGTPGRGKAFEGATYLEGVDVVNDVRTVGAVENEGQALGRFLVTCHDRHEFVDREQPNARHDGFVGETVLEANHFVVTIDAAIVDSTQVAGESRREEETDGDCLSVSESVIATGLDGVGQGVSVVEEHASPRLVLVGRDDL